MAEPANRLLKAPAQGSGSVSRDSSVADTVAQIIADVRSEGDSAVRRYSQKLDSWSPESFKLNANALAKIMASVSTTKLDDIRFVQKQVADFAKAQRDSIHDFEAETLPGVFLGQKNLPIAAAGAYVPGGRYPLTASAHMTILTAKVAGVEKVAATTPPNSGSIPPISAAAMHMAGADEIYLLGGVQAIAALALGTETIDPVDMIAGPGNAFVAEAKRQLYGEVGIDLFAGPTEILILADESSDPFVIAVDLLSQAEHGPDSPAILVTTSERVGKETLQWVDRLLVDLPTREVAAKAWHDRGAIHVVDDLAAAYGLSDCYGSEHVEVLTADPRHALDCLTNYGALFLGENTCVSFGDKVIGTNHVLPTRKASRYTGGLWVGKYLRTVTYQEVRNSESSASLGELCGRMSRLENFEGHARAGDLRAAGMDPERLSWVHESPVRI